MISFLMILEAFSRFAAETTLINKNQVFLDLAYFLSYSQLIKFLKTLSFMDI